MIQTMPLGHTHRDLMNRVIRNKDIVVWANRKQGSGMVIASVEGSTVETVRISRSDTGRLTNVNSNNLIVITAQVEKNVAGNVGANMDLEATR
ncbi:MAG: hypothetical protein ACRC6V_19185 [Bacteroidales bacterium]